MSYAEKEIERLRMERAEIAAMPSPSPMLVSVFGLIPPDAPYSETIDLTGTLAAWVEVR